MTLLPPIPSAGGYPMHGMTKAEKAKMEKQEAKWRADADLRTMIQAKEIEEDPKRYAAAMALHKEMSETLKSIEGDKE